MIARFVECERVCDRTFLECNVKRVLMLLIVAIYKTMCKQVDQTYLEGEKNW